MFTRSWLRTRLGLVLIAGLSRPGHADTDLSTMQPAEIEALQKRFTDGGCYTGPMDGQANDATAKCPRAQRLLPLQEELRAVLELVRERSLGVRRLDGDLHGLTVHLPDGALTILQSEAPALIGNELLTSAVTRILGALPERSPSVSPIAVFALALSLAIDVLSKPGGGVALRCRPPGPRRRVCLIRRSPKLGEPPKGPAGLLVRVGPEPLGSSGSSSEPPPEPPDPKRSFKAEATVLACACCSR